MDLRKKTELIVIHCAATKASMDIGASEIKKWHVDDNGWDDIGYHYIIKRGGLVEVGRPEAFQGAHAPAVNSKSIAICLIGGININNVHNAINLNCDLIAISKGLTSLKKIEDISKKYYE